MPASETILPHELERRLDAIDRDERDHPSRAALSGRELWLYIGVCAAIALVGILVLAL